MIHAANFLAFACIIFFLSYNVWYISWRDELQKYPVLSTSVGVFEELLTSNQKKWKLLQSHRFYEDANYRTITRIFAESKSNYFNIDVIVFIGSFDITINRSIELILLEITRGVGQIQYFGCDPSSHLFPANVLVILGNCYNSYLLSTITGVYEYFDAFRYSIDKLRENKNVKVIVWVSPILFSSDQDNYNNDVTVLREFIAHKYVICEDEVIFINSMKLFSNLVTNKVLYYVDKREQLKFSQFIFQCFLDQFRYLTYSNELLSNDLKAGIYNY